MTQLITNLFKQIEDLPRTAEIRNLSEIVRDWNACTEVWIIRQTLVQWLKESASLDQLGASARETSTHYVWPVYTTASGYRIVINEFKNPGKMTAGYATTVHNHRYSFASLMLSGRYRQVSYDVEMNGYGQATGLCEIGSDSLAPGSIVTVTDDLFHRITDIENRTMTLIIRCPAVKDASISVDIRTLMTSRHLPVEARVAQLMDTLAAVEQSGTRKGN
jgi:hypothetical protein